ncbi:MAG TPA: DUF58 domain-containing protein [Acidimicrobiales bacterium]|nr:DUF58 domain-containing protein [Acidimicrobiales bacterium]
MKGTALTASGRAVLGGSVVLYALGVLLGYRPLVSLAAGGLLAVAAGTTLVARRALVDIERRLDPARVVVGESARALVVVTNRARTASPPFTAVDTVGDGTADVSVGRIPPGATARVPYPVPAPRRGLVRLGPILVSRSDPLGLVRRRAPHAAPQALWVHPRAHPLLPVPSGMALDLEGPVVETALQGAITFSSLREYVPGDDVRQIHWRSTARTGTLMVRQHVDTSQPRTTVVLDQRESCWTPAAFEHGVEAAASVAVAAERSGHPATLEVATPATPDEAGRPSSALDLLALVSPCPDAGPQPVDRLEVLAGGGALVVVTGRPDGATAGRVAALRRRYSLVVLVHVHEGAAPFADRRPGMLLLTAPTGADFASLWNAAVAR